MIKLIQTILCVSLIASNVYSKEEGIKNPYFGGLSILSLSYYSEISYEDAMNEYSRLKPDGYVVESINYIKSGRSFIVKVKMRKI